MNLKPKPKTVVFDTYHIPDKKTQTPWADIWVSFTSRPGRKKISLGPCLISRKDVERQIETEKRFVKDSEGIPALEKLLTDNVITVKDKPHKDMPTIYWPGEWITRESAEICIAHWLKERFGFQSIRAKWARKKIVIHAA